MITRFCFLLLACGLASAVLGATPDRDRALRDRYEKVLARNPFQDTAFSRVYDGYVQRDGLDAWIAKLKKSGSRESRVVLTRIHERQFDHANAIKQLAALADYDHPQFSSLAGRIYYRTGDDRKAAEHLTKAVDHLRDLEERSQVCRILGHIHLRQGKRDAAIEVWKRIVGEDNADIFALTELASIYEDNRMWEEAIGVYQRIIKGANDPYRHCQALRQIGIAHLQSERHAQAIASFEKAFDLVAPGNWMFEDLKQRLVSVYQDQGDLKGLLGYLDSRIEAQPGDLDFRLLRAETLQRLKRPDDAEQELRYILERRPRDAPTYEELLSFYEEQDKTGELIATYEKLIELFPSSLDYLRRLGEYQLRDGNRAEARKTWLRVLNVDAGADTWVMLAGWYADNEMSDDAISAYESALKLDSRRDWMLQLADLKHEAGDREGALALWKSSLGSEPEAGELAEVAMILDRHRMDAEADVIFRRVLAEEPDDHETRARLARSLMRRRDFQSALKQFDRLAAQEESEYLRQQGERGQLEAYRRLGVLAAKQKEWETKLAADTNSVALISRLISVHERNGRQIQALALHRRRVEIEPDNTEHQRRLAMALSRGRQFDEAIEAFQTLADQDRARSRVHLQELLYLHNRTFGRDKAIATAERIVSLAPNDPEVHLQLAQTLMRYRRNEDALAEFRKAANLNSEEPKYWQQYGELLLREDKWNEANLVYERMLDVAVTADMRGSALAGLTQIAVKTERLDEFLSRLKSRVRKTPKKIDAYEDLATVYRAADRMEDAITSIEDGLTRVDDRAPMLRSLIRYAWEAKDFRRVRQYYQQLVYQRGRPGPFEYERLGRIHARLGEREQAVAAWQKIIDEFPDNLRALDRLVRVYEAEKFYPEALNLREDLLDRDPDDRKGRYQYARLLVQTGKEDEAFEQLYRLLDSVKDAPTNTVAFLGTTTYPRIRFAGRYTISPTYFGRDLKPYFRMVTTSSRSKSGSPITWSGSPRSVQNLIQDITALAVRFKKKDAVVAHWNKWIEEDPENLRIRRGLVELYEGLRDLDNTVKASREYAKKSPEDDEMRLKTSLYLCHAKEYDQSIRLLDGVIGATNRYSPLAGQAKVAVLLADGKGDEAESFARAFLRVEKGGVDSRSSIAGLMKTKARYAYARELFEEVKIGLPSLAEYSDYSLAEISNSEGKKEEAIRRYRELLFGEGSNGPQRSLNTTIYTPRSSTYSHSFTSSYLGFPSHVVRLASYYRARSLSMLASLVPDFEASEIMKELRLRVTTSARKLHGKPDLHWERAKMLSAWHLKEKEFDEMLQLLDSLPDAVKNRVEWYNLKLFTHHMKLDFDAMETVYDSYEERFPGANQAVAKARVEFGKARGRNRAPMTYRSVRSSSILGSAGRVLVTPSFSNPVSLNTARIEAIKSLFKQRKDVGIRLLKSEISRSGRTPPLLGQLARFYLADGQTNEAIKTITEAWERRRPDSSTTTTKSFFLKAGDTLRVTIKIDPVVATMNECFRTAKKLPQLYSLLETKAGADKSKRALFDRAHTYLLNHELKKALTAFEEISKTHNDVPEVNSMISRIKKAIP